jgi:hypothetical protein
LPYLASFLLLAPAIANLVLVIVWRASDDPQITLRGRCRWDIDVVWSGVGLICDRSPSFASWVGSAVSRLSITSMVLVRLSDCIRPVCSASRHVYRADIPSCPGNITRGAAQISHGLSSCREDHILVSQSLCTQKGASPLRLSGVEERERPGLKASSIGLNPSVPHPASTPTPNLRVTHNRVSAVTPSRP